MASPPESTARRVARKLRAYFFGPLLAAQERQTDLLLYAQWRKSIDEAKNPLNKFGAKYFSQTDEDGITLEILRRIGGEPGVFAEFGVGDGSENNTLILLAMGWRGFWVGGEELFFDYRNKSPRFAFVRAWLDRDNIVGLAAETLRRLESASIDVVSLDVDGNDLYLVKALLQARVLPKLFIVEYNAKFPPPIKWQIEYDKDHRWQHDDYFGASLASFDELFRGFGYTLVCCNAHTGANAFFIRDEFLGHFSDVPRDLGQLYYGPRYYLYQSFGHKASPKTIEQILRLSDRAGP